MGAHSTFRAGVVAVIRRDDGSILAFERADVRGAWQLPQGGIGAGENPYETVWREVEEETGLTAESIELVAEYPEWVAYELPEDRRLKKTGLGQVQRWFVFRALRADIVPVPDQREFVAWNWVAPDWLVEQVVDFRRSGYARVLGTI